MLLLYWGSCRQDGKLRLLYEGAPMSFIMEQAGGKAGPNDKPTLIWEGQQRHILASVCACAVRSCSFEQVSHWNAAVMLVGIAQRFASTCGGHHRTQQGAGHSPSCLDLIRAQSNVSNRECHFFA